MSSLPPTLAEIADLIGSDKALAIARERGGTRVYIPAHAIDDHWLVDIVGRDAADQLCAAFARQYLEIPLGPRSAIGKIRADVDRMIEEGHSERKIALATGYSIRGVRKRRGRRRDDPRQRSLF